MKRWAWISVFCLVIVGAGLAWFWSLAAVSPDQTPAVVLKIEHGPVQVRSGEATYHDAADGMTLASGMTIKTGDGARATIQFFGQAESRLDAGSETTISQADYDASIGRMNVQLDLGTGRVWSRVLRLFDLDSGFSVKTSSVVATVRGTAFDVRALSDGTSEVWVSESAVSITSNGATVEPIPPADQPFHLVTSTPALAEGESAMYGKDGKAMWRKPIPAEDRASQWFGDNHAADSVFEQAARTVIQKRLDKQNSSSGGIMGGLIGLSERMHVALAKDGAGDRHAEAYAARRLASAVVQAQSGHTGSAAQIFSRMENEMRTQSKGSDAGRNRQRMRVALERITPLLNDASPSSPAYPFKQRTEDMAVSMQDTDPSRLYTRLLAVDARLDEADRLLDANAMEEARMALDAAHSGLDNIRRDADPVLTGLNGKQKDTLSGKIVALLARLSVEEARLNAAMAPLMLPPDATTSTTSTASIPPGTKPGKTGTSGSVNNPPTGASMFTQISAVIQPNPIALGGSGSIIVLGKKADGSTTNVTAKSTFKLIRGSATLSGSKLTATQEGSVTIEATYNDGGTVRTAQASVIISQAVMLSSIKTAASPTTIAPGASSSLSATAVYSNGYQAVISGVTWDNLSPNLGTLSGNTFTAGTQAIGTANIEGTYTENGVTKTATVSVTIQYRATSVNGVPTN